MALWYGNHFLAFDDNGSSCRSEGVGDDHELNKEQKDWKKHDEADYSSSF